MLYEEQNKARDTNRKYIEQSYRLPYNESMAKTGLEDESESDPDMQIFLKQITKLTIYSTSVTDYRVKLREEND